MDGGEAPAGYEVQLNPSPEAEIDQLTLDISRLLGSRRPITRVPKLCGRTGGISLGSMDHEGGAGDSSTPFRDMGFAMNHVH